MAYLSNKDVSLIYTACDSATVLKSPSKVLDIYRGTSSLSAGQNIDIWTDNDLYAQKFYLNYHGTQNVRAIVPVNKQNTAIGIASTSTANNVNVQLKSGYNPKIPPKKTDLWQLVRLP